MSCYLQIAPFNIFLVYLINGFIRKIQFENEEIQQEIDPPPSEELTEELPKEPPEEPEMVKEPKTPKATTEPKTLNMVEEEPKPKKRGRPKKEPAPKPEPKKRGRPPKKVIVDETPQVASIDPNVYNQQLFQALIAHNNASKQRRYSQWSSLVRF